jgi:hypothetical protein
MAKRVYFEYEPIVWEQDHCTRIRKEVVKAPVQKRPERKKNICDIP